MKLMNLIRKLHRINIHKYIYYNYFSRKVVRKGKGRIIPYGHAVIDVAKTAKIVLHDGNFILNANKPKGSKAECYVKLRAGGVLEILDITNLFYWATIEIHKDAKVTIGSANINSWAVILAAKSITIGKEVLVSRNVMIYDADHHPIVDENGKQLNPPKPVVIGNHVWIGLKSIVLKGSTIGDGALISADSIVGGKIRAGTMAAGNPARSYAEVTWRVN